VLLRGLILRECNDRRIPGEGMEKQQNLPA
jgi:hypothetical protein